MACVLVTEFKEHLPHSATLKCSGECDKQYVKRAGGYDWVDVDCKIVTEVSWDNKLKTFVLGATKCVCVLGAQVKDEDKCRLVRDTETKDGVTTTTGVKCVGGCGEFFHQKEKEYLPTKTKCIMVLEREEVTCVCIVDD